MQNTYCDECGKRAHPGKCESAASFVVEYYSHENEYHWQETGTFLTKEKAMRHYEMKRLHFPNARWRVTQVVQIVDSRD